MVKCDCGGRMRKDRTIEEGFLIDCIKCESCGQVGFMPGHVKQLIKLRELNKGIEGRRKIVKVGSSIAALLPKKMEMLGVKLGDVDIRVLSSNSIEVSFGRKFRY